MKGRFAAALARMHCVGVDRLSDETADYLDGQGNLVAEDVPIMNDKDVVAAGFEEILLDPRRSLSALRAHLPAIHRGGSFQIAGKAWHIDGIAADDGHLITFYVVP